MDKGNKIIQTNKETIIFYHNDQDGFTGAWAAWKKFKNKADYIPIKSWSEEIILENNGKKIYFLDFSFDFVKMKKLAENNKVILIDHHLTSQPVAQEMSGSLHDTNRSGAVLSWKYFHPDKKIPRIALYVEDMDIWKFKLPFSKEITATLELNDFNFETWNNLAKSLENKDKKKIPKIAEEGSTILKYQNTLINKVIENGQEVIFEGHESFAVNSPVLISEIGHKIYDSMNKLAIVWSHKWDNGNEILRISLRSNKKINVSKLAEKYGGGGHKGAASFGIKSGVDFPWQIK